MCYNVIGRKLLLLEKIWNLFTVYDSFGNRELTYSSVLKYGEDLFDISLKRTKVLLPSGVWVTQQFVGSSLVGDMWDRICEMGCVGGQNLPSKKNKK